MRHAAAAPPDADASVTLRFAVFDDAPDLLRLAQLDSAHPLAEPILVAEVAGRLTAAVSLADDRVIADPFVLTLGAVELLRARAGQLTQTERRWRVRPRGGRRLRTLLRGRPAVALWTFSSRASWHDAGERERRLEKGDLGLGREDRGAQRLSRRSRAAA